MTTPLGYGPGKRPKHHLRARETRLRLRGLTGANDEFLLAATVQNLRRLALDFGDGQPLVHVMPPRSQAGPGA